MVLSGLMVVRVTLGSPDDAPVPVPTMLEEAPEPVGYGASAFTVLVRVVVLAMVECVTPGPAGPAGPAGPVLASLEFPPSAVGLASATGHTVV